ncbi:DUF6011 domain-containing protein [Streptomyces rubiginosohelvolus]|uniref:Helix-turn-helix DNA binding domain protein n=1 Tax=Streptomyces rubiginosohelvolus TaxID=67362 RepID=A0ABQ3BR02_9ACTN|nr:DUF6011 domain-containing protein [Streptomyces pluricolorescens]GGZ51568.1 hypothetical protein GCM10010328_27780 [Streptomyces pluricolorescens]
MTDTCGVCNRPLHDAESRAAGIGPTCAKKFHGSTATAGSHQLTFEEPMTDQPKTPAVWTDGDPLVEATASAVWEQCRTEGPSTVVDDPRTIAAVAATVARQVLGVGAGSKPSGRCGNDPRTVLSPGDHAAVTQFTEYLARRRRLLSAATEDEPETEEQRADREETERAHAAGDHEHCGPTCEVEFPSDMLRNTILYAALPGSTRMLNELLRRATAEAQAERDELHGELGLVPGQLHSAALSAIRGRGVNIRELASRAETAEAAIKRTVDAMRAYTVASGSAGVNPNQVIDLLSPTWPNGNHEAPGPGQAKTVFVVAGSSYEFENWCRENDRNPHDPQVRYLTRWYQLRGVKNPHIEYVGTYEERADWPQIARAIAAVSAREATP